ncbi:hypothetical protein GS498_19265 [Rhodococcus hoagii]|nr:hypothetical protein [Prescottella equi]
MKALPPGLNVQDAISGPWDMLLKSQGGKIPLHDEGGWLMPGLTMNLTKKPEPVLNPEQLANLRRWRTSTRRRWRLRVAVQPIRGVRVCRSPTNHGVERPIAGPEVPRGERDAVDAVRRGKVMAFTISVLGAGGGPETWFRAG